MRNLAWYVRFTHHGIAATFGWATALVFAGCVAAHADIYVLKVRQVLPDKTNTATISCVDDRKMLCRADVTLSVGGEEKRVTVVALAGSGEIYLKFRDGDAYLFAGSRPFFSVSVGLEERQQATILLYEPPPALIDDPQNSLLHFPVIRGTDHLLATLDLEIQRQP